ncbi:hypothetical protein CCACVL1_17689 [Corchorus capsularis]|uniref:Uncharacterized protein n=1 Tax=Corchorus capsularis TaxID=210143 RepID=A0A1R3HQP9_COCAP|nr:hypothetical protein CCACVL1_17689 [Corchorus capsularis]
MLMDIQAGIGSLSSHSFWKTSQKSLSSYSSSSFKIFCSKKDSQQPQQNGDGNGDKFSTDWDKAWSSFRKQSKKSFSQFSPNKYVTWNPRQSNYPLSEEVDPIKRTERSNLMLWTSPGFTLVGAIVIVSFLLLYTLLAPQFVRFKYSNNMGSLALEPAQVVELLPTLEDACRLDDKDSLILIISSMKKMFGESECCHNFSLLYNIISKIIKHDSVRCATALLEGEVTGIKVDIDAFFQTHSEDSTGWTPEQSIFRLIILLCTKSHNLSDRLEELRSLVENGKKEEVEEEIVNCVIEGKVMGLGALILAAPQKVTTTKFSFDDIARSNRSMTIRQYLLGEI